jgi:outer membrane protein assembly factor BamD
VGAKRAMSLLLTTLFLIGTPAGAAKKDPTVQERYEQGLKYMKRGYYVKALEEFNRIRNYHRDDPLALKAELAIADVYFKKAEWDQARVAYEDFMRMHPRNEDLDYVVYRLGLTSYKKAPRIAQRDQTWTRQAVHAWTGFENRYPDSEHLEEVQEMLARSRNRLAKKEYDIGAFYERREAWPAVEARMEDLLRVYADTDLVPDALALLAISQHHLGELEASRETAARLVAEHPDHAAVRKLTRDAPELL